MTRTEIHTEFAKRFSTPRLDPYPLQTGEGDLLATGAALRTTFPRSYLSFVLAYGPPFTPDILDKLVDAREAGLPAPDGFAVQEFFSPSEIIETYRLYVSGGMEDSLIPFAMDACGNVLGFRREEAANRPDDCPVIFFDHDFCEISQVADSFDGWLRGFLLLGV